MHGLHHILEPAPAGEAEKTGNVFIVMKRFWVCQTKLTQHFPQPGEHSTKHSKGLPALSEIHGEADTRGVNSIPEHLEMLMNNYKYVSEMEGNRQCVCLLTWCRPV